MRGRTKYSEESGLPLQFDQGLRHLRVARMTVDIDKEVVLPASAPGRTRFKARHRHTVSRQRPHQFLAGTRFIRR